MKTANLVVMLLMLLILATLTIFSFFLGQKLTKTDNIQPYSAADSLLNWKLDSVKGVYQVEIDSIRRQKEIVKWRTKLIRDVDTVIYSGGDTACIEIIERKNRLIAGLDSVVELLDVEARTYSDLLLIEQQQRGLEIRRNAALSLKVDSCIKSNKDTLTAISKRLDTGFFRRNSLWNKNKFRNYIKTGQK